MVGMLVKIRDVARPASESQPRWVVLLTLQDTTHGREGSAGSLHKLPLASLYYPHLFDLDCP